jgi:NADH-quinone oxidoreductase subunit M
VIAAGVGVILSAVYMLWMFQRAFFGTVTNDHNLGLPDLRPREWAAVVPLCAMAIFMGVFPSIFLRPMEPAVEKLVERLQASQPLRVNNAIQDSTGNMPTAPASTDERRRLASQPLSASGR